MSRGSSSVSARRTIEPGEPCRSQLPDTGSSFGSKPARALTSTLLLVCLLLSAVAAEGRCRKKEDEAQTPYRQLAWSDFKGKWPEQQGPAAARISSGMNLYHAEQAAVPTDDGVWVASIYGICLFAQMDKYQSAVRPGSKTPGGLAHEQGHFDLTEYHTRLLYQELLTLEGRGEDEREALHALRTKLDQTYARAVEMWRGMEQTYDRETNHGTRRRAQKAWLKRIQELLESQPPAGRGRSLPPPAGA